MVDERVEDPHPPHKKFHCLRLFSFLRCLESFKGDGSSQGIGTSSSIVEVLDSSKPHETITTAGFAPESAGRLSGDETITQLHEVLEDMTAEEVALIEAIYDEEVRHTDDGIGRLLASLRESGRYEDTWIVVVSDHGEEFLAHGNIGHTITLFEELVKVPLVVRPPAHATGPRRVAAPVTLVSLMPTLLEGIRKEWPAYGQIQPVDSGNNR